MGVLSIQLVLAAVLAGPSAGSAAAPRELASTYDEATCATVHAGEPGEMDGWDRAAIGEDAPTVPVVDEDDCPASPVALPRGPIADCNDPAVSPWLGEMIGTCDMPRNTALRPASLKAARRTDERRAQRLLAELSGTDGGAPLAPPENDREASPPAVVVSAPALPAPALDSRLEPRVGTPLRSISGDPLLRPPRA